MPNIAQTIKKKKIKKSNLPTKTNLLNPLTITTAVVLSKLNRDYRKELRLPN